MWSKGAPAFDKVANSCIQLINLKARYKPFAVVDPKGAVIRPFASYANTRHAPGSNFLCWDHWPVVLDKGDVSTTVDYSRPSHSSLSHIVWPACEKSANPVFIVENWGDAAAVLKLHGKPVSRGPNFRLGHRRRLEGTDLIVWVKAQSVRPMS